MVEFPKVGFLRSAGASVLKELGPPGQFAARKLVGEKNVIRKSLGSALAKNFGLLGAYADYRLNFNHGKVRNLREADEDMKDAFSELETAIHHDFENVRSAQEKVSDNILVELQSILNEVDKLGYRRAMGSAGMGGGAIGKIKAGQEGAEKTKDEGWDIPWGTILKGLGGLEGLDIIRLLIKRPFTTRARIARGAAGRAAGAELGAKGGSILGRSLKFAGRSAKSGAFWMGIYEGLRAMKDDKGHKLRSELRALFGIEDDPNEPAPWEPGGDFHKDEKSTEKPTELKDATKVDSDSPIADSLCYYADTMTVESAESITFEADPIKTKEGGGGVTTKVPPVPQGGGGGGGKGKPLHIQQPGKGGGEVPAGEGEYGKISASKQETASVVADEWRKAGMSEAGIAGVLANIQSESGFNPNLRHPDQPHFGGEAHFAHGLYQEGGTEWNKYEAWINKNYPGADWHDPRLQSRFAAWNLQTNYPETWSRMLKGTKEQAAQAYVGGYLKPAAVYRAQRESAYGRGVPGIEKYTGEQGQTTPTAPGAQKPMDSDKGTDTTKSSAVEKAQAIVDSGKYPPWMINTFAPGLLDKQGKINPQVLQEQIKSHPDIAKQYLGVDANGAPPDLTPPRPVPSVPRVITTPKPPTRESAGQATSTQNPTPQGDEDAVQGRNSFGDAMASED